MDGFTREDKYKRSVVQIALYLHGVASGTTDHCGDPEEHAARIDWLTWRVCDFWDVTRNSKFRWFDDSVKGMALSALEESK